MHRIRLAHLLNRPTPPLLILGALIAFGGCTVADPYYVDDSPFAAATSVQLPALNSSQVWVAPLQLRHGPSGDCWLDLLIAGDQAPLAANRWAQTPPESSQINAIVSLRRVTPDPSPIRLATHNELKPMPRSAPASLQWQASGARPSPTRLVLSVPLKPRDWIGEGRYEIRLTPPNTSEASAWRIQGLDITLDERPVESTLSN
ncbi:MAG: hypothetical protein QM783_16165 [Phycisphaerales bacterium]